MTKLRERKRVRSSQRLLWSSWLILGSHTYNIQRYNIVESVEETILHYIYIYWNMQIYQHTLNSLTQSFTFKVRAGQTHRTFISVGTTSSVKPSFPSAVHPEKFRFNFSLFKNGFDHVIHLRRRRRRKHRRYFLTWILFYWRKIGCTFEKYIVVSHFNKILLANNCEFTT